MTEKKPIDWEAVETDYRAGILSLREMAAAHGVSHVSIKKRADRDGWTRDLSAKIKAQADALVNRRVVTSLGNTERAVNDRLVIEANAERIAQVRSEHRADISRARRLALLLLGELEGVTENIELFRELGETLRSEDDKGADKRNDLYAKVIDLPSRVDSAKKLSETLKNLIALEREAYGLEAAPTTLNVEQRTTVVDAHAVKEVIDRLEADY
jgi:hypothetical protein